MDFAKLFLAIAVGVIAAEAAKQVFPALAF
jgi:hypothetical protein